MKLFPVLSAIVVSGSVFAEPVVLVEKEYSDFDEFVLAVSWQPSFCQYKYQSLVAEEGAILPIECNPVPRVKKKSDYLTVHGLWPSLPKSIANKMKSTDKKEDRWRSEGCAVLGGIYKYYSADQKCIADALNFTSSTVALLGSFMPGANPSSCLERYEYAKHGSCFGYDHNNYFNAMIGLVAQLRASTVGLFIEERYGESFTLNDISGVIKLTYGANAPSAFEFACTDRGGKTYLDEIRVTLQKQGLDSGLNYDGKIFGAVVGEPKNNKCGKYIFLDTRGF
jgi:ribonuclease I